MEPTRTTFEVEPEGRVDRVSHLEVLVQEIDVFEKNVAVLEQRLMPVLSRNNVVRAVDSNEEIADHQLHEQVHRLGIANKTLEALISQIAL